MFEKFTETALKIIMAAQKEARILNNNFVGTEHILLGLLAEKSQAQEILNCLGCNQNNIMETIEKGSDVVGVEIPFTSEAKELFQKAWTEAKKYEQPITELHLLIALTYSEGKHLQSFKDLNIDIDKIKTLSLERAKNFEIKRNNLIFIAWLIITSFFVRNKRTICLVIGILFIAILILVSIAIGKYKY